MLRRVEFISGMTSEAIAIGTTRMSDVYTKNIISWIIWKSGQVSCKQTQNADIVGMKGEGVQEFYICNPTQNAHERC